MDCIWSLCVWIGAVLTIFALSISIPSIKRKWFSWYYTKIAYPFLVRSMDPPKRELLKNLDKIKSRDPKLREKDSIRILEIGIGPGVNLKFYPSGCHLIGLDYNPEFMKFAEENIKTKGSHLYLERHVCCSVEHMETVIPDESVDVVVGTYVFCSIPDRKCAMENIKRALVPGGKFYFFEHVLCIESKLIAAVQNLLNPTWKFLMDGCHLNRRMIPLVENAGFSKTLWTHCGRMKTGFLLGFIEPYEMGVVEK